MKKLFLLLSLFPVILLKAQVSAYSFTRTTSVYSPATGGTLITTATANTATGSVNNVIYNLPAASFPFTFVYNGTGYTGCNISSNGFITFGSTAPAGTLYTPLSSAVGYAGAISAWGGDLNSVFSLGTASVTGQIRVETVGIAPDREFVIQWSNWRPANSVSTTNAHVMNFQIRLEETTNKISVVYGGNNYLTGSTAITGARQIGLRGATNADFQNRSNSSTVLFTSSVNGGANTSVQTFSTTGSVPAMPSNGLTYMWQALVPCSGTPSAGDAVSSNSLLCSSSTVTLALVNSTTGSNNLSYQWQSSPNGSSWTSIPSATTIVTTRNVSATTYFQCIVACGSSSATSTPVLVTYGAPVTGGMVTSSSTLLCMAGQTVTLGLTSSSSFPEVNYQWQSSPNGSSWTSVPSATLSSLNQTIAATTYYQALVSCGTNTANATPVQVTISPVIINTIPYAESFEDISMEDQLPNCSWKASDLPTTCKTYTAATGSYNQYAKTGTKFASFNYDTNPAGDYFYSNGLQLTGGVNYIASVDYITDGASGWSEFKLLYGATQSTTGLNPIISVIGAITNTLYANAAGTFSVASTGIYYVAVKAIGNTNPWYLTFDDLEVSVAPPCTLTPVAGTITGPPTVLSGTTNSFSISPATGTIQWYSSLSSTGPWSVIGGANNAINQSITTQGSGNIYYTAVASIPGCINDTANLPLNVMVNFPGDNVCNAIPLSIGTSGYYKPYGATVQGGEVVPPGTGCTTNRSWCNATLNNSMWFSFVAPASGYVSIQVPSSLNGGNNDSQLALWSASSCNALLSTSTATLLAANDDDAAYVAHSGAQYSSYIRAACLTPGTTYYIQFDTSADATPEDSTRIVITNLGTLNTSFTGLAATYCLPSGNSVLTPAASGGVFTLNTATTTISSFNPTTAGVGTHTVNYSIYGCRSASTTIVSNSPNATAATSNSALCVGSSATLTAGGAVNYTWSPISINTASTVVSPTVTTTYTLTGSNGTCAATRTVNITVSSTPAVTAATTNSVICAGTSVTLTAAGATNYTWMPGGVVSATAIVTPTTNTTYTVTGRNGICSATKTIAVTINSALALSATASSTSICTGSSVTLTASGATNYTWMPGSITSSVAVLTPTSNTTYTLTGLSGSCTGTKTLSINVTTTPTVTATRSSSVICSGSSATLTATGALNYTWTPGVITSSIAVVSPTINTTYTVIGRNGSCPNTKTISVNVTASPTVNAVSSNTAICSGSASTLTAGGAVSYTWMPGAITTSVTVVTPTINTTYTLTGKSGTCSNTKTISVNVTSTPTVSASSSNSVICEGAPVTLTAGGATNYTWSPVTANTATLSDSPLSSTIYTVSGDNGLCSSTTTIGVSVTPNPALSLVASSASVCAASTVTLTAGGAASYTWSSSANTTNTEIVTPNANTGYTVTGEDNGCFASNSITISITSNPTVTVNSNSVICAGSSATLTAGGAFTYSWMPTGGINNTETVTPTATTIYTVTGSNGNCASTTTVSVDVNPLPTVSATASQTLLCNDGSTGSSVLTAISGATTYIWSDGATTVTTAVTPTITSIYTVTVNDGLCSAEAYITISVSNCTGVDELQANVITLFPNPNNGVVTISISSTLTDNTSIEVYDALGKLVMKELLNSESSVIKTNTLEEGIYLYKIIRNNQTLKAGRMVKN